jgi:subtilisin family serine protease
MKNLSIFLILIGLSISASGQDTKIIFLKDNTKECCMLNLSQFVSLRSIERRSRQGIGFDLLDAPVNKSIISQLSQHGEVLNVSRWLNALTIKSTLSSEELLVLYPFIQRIQVIKDSKTRITKFSAETKSLNYGLAIDQVQQLNLDCLHDLGFKGSGVYLAVIDAGFRSMDTIPYFDSVYIEGRVLDRFNFVSSNSTVYDFSGHGTAVSSCIVGEKSAPEEYAGTGVNVDLALYLSEDVTSETEIEEFNLVAALERCDSVGVDVVNISLGYFEYDDSTTSHVYSDLDGITTISAIGVNIAASKGIFVASSAGNSGPSTISTPCDATGTFCVGAVDEFGDLAPFSSIGPSVDGRVKPDIAARGKDAWLIGQSGVLGEGSGTSFSSPIIAGATACLIQANPNRTVQEVMDAIRQSASQFSFPDEFKGYGIPDFCIAHEILSDDTGLNEFNENNLVVYPVPANATIFIAGFPTKEERIKIDVINRLGEVVLSIEEGLINGQFELDASSLSNGMYTLVISQRNGQVRRNVSVIN